MARFLAYLLTVLLLLQTFSRELVVLDYQVHKERITRLFCVNKARPQLRCNGQCHLGKQLRKAADAQSKAPAAGFAKIKYEALLPLRPVFVRPAAEPARPGRFPHFRKLHYAFTPVHSVFHPPTPRV
ncbi:hypothetical protein SAMN02745146_2050 [Hymenobacter daecheongensis DSM 21074]|uniref:Uncharacterized protein n=1 Tax=Hymenobacter daecheongensis DSM 21074 TaxID=1121955 RepID=A0A1M6FZD0_9BACT|nr:hypothetical protein [Hymenobacter daecheongensis]SHJ02979.1 hypothetical protein SAMN02745146_2050 [Hymenobacter daecheongensis DSM 21074]